jgi:hypothetical protein
MPAISSRADPSEAADVSPTPAVNTTPAPNSGEKRLLSLWGLERVKQFTVRLKVNAKWMKQFLHGGPRHKR